MAAAGELCCLSDNSGYVVTLDVEMGYYQPLDQSLVKRNPNPEPFAPVVMCSSKKISVVEMFPNSTEDTKQAQGKIYACVTNDISLVY